MSLKYSAIKKNLERKIDTNLLLFSQLKGNQNKLTDRINLLSEDNYHETKKILDQLLSEYHSLIDELIEESNVTTDVAVLRTVKSLKENYAIYMAELRQTDCTIINMFERNDLLGLANSSNKNSADVKPRFDTELARNVSLLNLHTIVDDEISLVLNTRQNLRDQHTTLKRTQKRISNIFVNLPKINKLIQRINAIKRRETIIVFSVAFGLILLYLLA